MCESAQVTVFKLQEFLFVVSVWEGEAHRIRNVFYFFMDLKTTNLKFHQLICTKTSELGCIEKRGYNFTSKAENNCKLLETSTETLLL